MSMDYGYIGNKPKGFENTLSNKIGRYIGR